jgi:hypothetical protein
MPHQHRRDHGRFERRHDADIILSGAGSTIETTNTSAGVTNTIDTTLCTIGASGELQLLAGRNWATAGAAITPTTA